MKVGEDSYNVAQDRKKWSTAWSQNLGGHQQEERASGPIGEKTVLCVVNVGSGSGERETRHVMCVCVSHRAMQGQQIPHYMHLHTTVT